MITCHEFELSGGAYHESGTFAGDIGSAGQIPKAILEKE